MRWPARFGFAPPQRSPSPSLLAAMLIVLGVGVLRYASRPLTPCWTPSDLAHYNLPAERAFDDTAPNFLITGYINSYPLLKEQKQQVYVAATSILIDGEDRPVQGTLRLSTRLRQKLQYGQRVLIRGRLVTPPDFEDFSYRDYLTQRSVYSVVYGARVNILEQEAPQGDPIRTWLYRFRSRGESLLNRLLAEPYAALANGMLLGIEAGIPDDLYAQFNATGASHVIVISGSNVALIAGIFFAVGRRIFGKRLAIWPTLTAIAAYALLVGGDPAVLRAACMGGLVVVASALNRQSTAIISLATACWAMTLANPLTLWDVGFQLSSAATAGLILFSPAITKRLKLDDSSQKPATEATSAQAEPTSVNRWRTKTVSLICGIFSEALIATLAANVTTLALVIYYFGRLSLVSVLTNLLIVPIQPIILVAGSAGVLIGVAGLELLASLLLKPVHLCLWWTVTMVQWTASLPGAGLPVIGYDERWLLITYITIAILSGRSWFSARWQSWVGRGRRGWRWRRALAVAGIFLLLAALFIFPELPKLPNGKLEIYFLDIGQGDGVLIQTPRGRQVLIDGGKEPGRLRQQLREVLPWWDRRLDLVILTHPDSDHMQAQAQLPDSFRVDQAILSKVSADHIDAQSWRANYQVAGTTIHMRQAGATFSLDKGVQLSMLWPPPSGLSVEQIKQYEDAGRADSRDNSYDNENGIVVMLTYGAFRLLLPADLGYPGERALLAQNTPLQATVLKIGHHGSQYSSSKEFLQAVSPQVCVIQVGAENEYGHPHQALLKRLQHCIVLRNDQQGRIRIGSNGQQLWLAAERNWRQE
jgi:competence protein ComEC